MTIDKSQINSKIQYSKSQTFFEENNYCCPVKIYYVPMGLSFKYVIPFLPTFCPDGTVP